MFKTKNTLILIDYLDLISSVLILKAITDIKMQELLGNEGYNYMYWIK